MKLYRTLRAAELRPVIHLQTQIDRRGIKAHQLIFEPKLLFPEFLVATPRHQRKEDMLIQFPGPMLIGIGKRGTARHRYPQMLQLALTTPPSTSNLP